MLFLFGEQIKSESIEEGVFNCPVCRDQQRYQRVVETNYFTVFMLPVLAITKLADYCQCAICGSSFDPGDYAQPAANIGVKRALVYIMMGYEMEAHKNTVAKLYKIITHFNLADSDIVAEMRHISDDHNDLFSFMKSLAPKLNIQGKQKVLEATFLMTYVSCEIEHSDRLRVNLVGNALGLPLEYVEAMINRIRSKNYYQIKRNLAVF